MFEWAQSTFDKISQTVAPPPTDGAGRFAYNVQRGEEDTAMGCIAEIDPVNTVVNQTKGLYPIHMACQYSMIRLVQLLMNQPGQHVEQTDLRGNTPLHYAAMSSDGHLGLECVKLMISQYGASVLSKNALGQTPYDVASLNVIRQYLLPIQLQAETKIALENGGQGLPPGIDLGGLRITNSHIPPPPTQFGAPPPTMQSAPPQTPPGAPAGAPAGVPVPAGVPAGVPPAPNMFATPMPTESRVASAPASTSPAPASGPAPGGGGHHEYSRVGSSSAAIYASKYRADGFHSSSSDVSLQRKYGHVGTSSQVHVPPPPSSGDGSIPSAPSSANAGPNPFAAGANLTRANPYSAMPPANRRYVAYGQVASAPASQPVYTNHYNTAATMPANMTMFTPGGNQQQSPTPAPAAYQQPVDTPSAYAASQEQQAAYGAQSYGGQPTAPVAPAPATPSTPYMPPPPYQSHDYETRQGQAYQRPDFVSPAAATYGSPATPGAMSTPTLSVASPANAFQSNPTYGAPASATQLFSAPPTATAGPAEGSSNAKSSAFVAPLPAVTEQPSTATAAVAFSAPAPTTEDAFAAPSPKATANAEDAFSAPAPAIGQEPQVGSNAFASQSHTQASSAASDAFVAPAPQTQVAAASDVFSSPSNESQGIPAVPTNATSVFAVAPQPQQVPAHQTLESIPSTRAQVFGTSQERGMAPRLQQGISPFDIPSKDGILRAKSAEELFGMEPPSEQPQQQSTSEPAKQLFSESAPTHQVAHVEQAAGDAAAVFGAAGSGSAEKAFGSVSQQSQLTASVQIASEPNTELTNSNVDDGEMDDVPLTPAVDRIVPQPAETQPGTTAASADSFFASIGMPPPPFSKKR